MKLWISFEMTTHQPTHELTTVHFTEPKWVEHEHRVGGGRWSTDDSDGRHPCWQWVKMLLPDIELPTQPSELLEIEIKTAGFWTWE